MKGARRSVERASVLRMDERGRQVTRLLDLLRALEGTRRGLSVRELIEQLDPNRAQRMVYRDLEHLQAAGFAVVCEDARYRIEGTTLRSDALRPSQVLALLLASDLMAPLGGLGIERDLRALVESLRARLTSEGRQWIDLMRSTMVARTNAPHHHLDPATLDAIEDALFVEQTLEIDYARPNQAAKRRIVEPHLIWCLDGRTYLVAYCRKSQEFRSFAIQRIRGAVLQEEVFERRPEFDPEQYVDQGFGAFHGPKKEVLLEFSPEVAYLTEERIFHSTQNVERLDDGSAYLRMTAGGLPEIAAWVASFGGKVRAIQPPELVNALSDLHRAGWEAHGAEVESEDPSSSSTSSAAQLRDTSRETPESRKNSTSSPGLT